MIGPVRSTILVLALAVLALVPSAFARHEQAPRIWLAAPAAVAGTGFHPGRVTVTAPTADGKVAKSSQANSAGRFTVRFASPVTAHPCRVSVVTAVGADGLRATLRLAGGRECPPPVGG